jgi:FKBP-type peptidyl-prolyl cis-trans isomerase SlyD
MKQRVISFHYTLTDKSGKVLDSSVGHEALSYMEGSGQIIPGLEKQLTGLKKGDKKKVSVPALEAYGLWDDKKIITVSRDELPTKDVKVGDRFSGGEDAHAPVFVVTQLTKDNVTLDGNHPLAGVDLTFDVELTEVRDATSEELSHGHAHGEHGHSH